MNISERRLTMKITKIWFDGDYIYGTDTDGRTYRQSLLWYKRLRNATDKERAGFSFGLDGIHWRNLDEDVSFESFAYDDAEPSTLQRFFLSHPEINIAEFAKKISLNPSLLRSYINGFKKPSKERERMILEHIHNFCNENMVVPL